MQNGAGFHRYKLGWFVPRQPGMFLTPADAAKRHSKIVAERNPIQPVLQQPGALRKYEGVMWFEHKQRWGGSAVSVGLHRTEGSAADALAEKLGKSVKDLRRTKKKGNSKRKVKSESAQKHLAVMFGLYVRAAAELDVPIAALYPKDVVNMTQSAHSMSWCQFLSRSRRCS